ncbi:uncharacterized protein LOC123314028 [Coccinella septempunctata]|uniref:uncharacterized protein LOC123314028 n=1 Tax=Coccinella septempunctata TaxID=41139 RepID=UPI001D099CE4|nr:uncharacterized protein LOC123314028 [Coccinella septempunctata]
MMIQGRTSNMRVSAVDATEGCQNCGKKGHDSKDERGNIRKLAEIKKNTAECYSCGRPGHFARECRNNNRSGRRTQGGCDSCGQKGYWARECPRKNRQGRENFTKNRIQRTTPPGGGGDINMAMGHHRSEDMGKNADRERGRNTEAIFNQLSPFSREFQPRKQEDNIHRGINTIRIANPDPARVGHKDGDRSANLESLLGIPMREDENGKGNKKNSGEREAAWKLREERSSMVKAEVAEGNSGEFRCSE